MQYALCTASCLQKRQGRDYVFHVTHPGLNKAYGKHMCKEMLYSHTLVSEVGLACPWFRGATLTAKVDLREAQLLPYSSGEWRRQICLAFTS